MKSIGEREGLVSVAEYLEASVFDVFENANRYPGPSGLLTYVAEKALRPVVRSVLPEPLARAHLDGRVYVHKLPYALFIPYCSGHSVERLLRRGLKTPTITARPARHFDTFVDHVTNYLIAMQHYFSGAQAFGAVELYAGPFIRRDRLGYREIRQGVQRLIFNLNFPSRVGMQTPFTNFTVVLDAAETKLERDDAIYAGEPVGKLGEYLDEARLFVRALYEVHMEGDVAGRPFTFPIPTIMTTSKLLYDDPEIFDAVFGAAARRGTGYWLNTRVVDPNASFAMCCRINIDMNELRHALRVGGKSMRIRDIRRELEQAREEYIRSLEKQHMGGLWAMPDITGSKVVITVNLPRIALEARRDDEAFVEKLDETLALVRSGLEWFARRYERLAKAYPEFYSMVLEYVPEALRLMGSTYFLPVGVIGLSEAAAIMAGDPKAWTEGSRSQWFRMAEWMKKTVEHIVSRTREWSKKTGIPFNVEEVPGESAAARLAERDVQLFPELREYLPDPEEPIYSTSIAPYYAPMELWERVEVEERVQPVFTGGVIMHIFLGEEPDPEALASLTRKLAANTSLVYWSYTPALSVCPRCGWSSVGIRTTCPRCGGETEIWSRIVGYYRPLRNWNPARRREFWLRHHYNRL
ncbi:anaerobic ribonucleoside triphosphate reductase [Hyperthermus butylicus]|uniref:Ribonucleotide reductase, oxygen sensitive (RNR, class III) n=1 Tax=Hyperthermus butylicus (strain DSM 5456 / JCM 9403 / PLM1-5) TaxID=415426 RepID=A2BJ51_HYPBU|nr:anaerobic ribonucleoside triphosphate reductase [Hyperthermus butylicus]ABM80012.1 ribonucleotide reductase, oxygen sensitive (RNR, class III) [Hyperthermus butylicus DSM 5456]